MRRWAPPAASSGIPARSPPASPPTRCASGHAYAAAADHNAGGTVRDVIAIRVNPLPAGHEDFDYRNGGWRPRRTLP